MAISIPGFLDFRELRLRAIIGIQITMATTEHEIQRRVWVKEGEREKDVMLWNCFPVKKNNNKKSPNDQEQIQVNTRLPFRPDQKVTAHWTSLFTNVDVNGSKRQVCYPVLPEDHLDKSLPQLTSVLMDWDTQVLQPSINTIIRCVFFSLWSPGGEEDQAGGQWRWEPVLSQHHSQCNRARRMARDL